jgi:uncharacterized repeat protein (TIGR03806 family)
VLTGTIPPRLCLLVLVAACSSSPAAPADAGGALEDTGVSGNADGPPPAVDQGLPLSDTAAALDTTPDETVADAAGDALASDGPGAGDSGPMEVPYGLATRVPNPTCRPPRPQASPDGGAPDGGALPRTLAETGCFDPRRPSEPIAAAIPYALNAELWSDGLSKRRWMVLPDGAQITVLPSGDWDLPIGSVLLKEFSAPGSGKRIETRLLVRDDAGAWVGYTYVWNAAETEAVLADDAVPVSLGDGGPTWMVPSRMQCLACHNQIKGGSLGPETRQLNRPFLYDGARRANQIATLNHLGILSPPIVDPTAAPALLDPRGAGPVADRARAYLDVNCAHCHDGAGGKPDFRFDRALADMHICDVTPVHAVPGGGKLLAPGDPAHSDLILRMKDLGAFRMPKLGTQRVDSVAVSLLEEWVRATTTCP